MSLQAELIQYIGNTLVNDPEVKVDVDSRLIDTGIVDSMGLLQLIGFLEERTGLRIPDDDVSRENFQSVRDMERLVVRLRERR
jgi:acyl carrier protein